MAAAAGQLVERNNKRDAQEAELAEGEGEAAGGVVTPLEHLHAHGFTDRDLKCLKEAGYTTVEAVAYASSRLLQQVKGISEQKVAKLKEAVKGLVHMGFSSATEINLMRQQIVKLTTGCAGFDAILGGGIETGMLTEVFGEFRSGKTQVCHTLAVTSQLPVEQGGAEGRVAWIDSEGTFRPERITKIAERFGLDAEQVLENIAHARAYNVEHQTELLVQAASMMVEARFALLIVDSVTALYRSEYQGRGQLADRQGHLCQFLRKLQRMADEFGIAVVYTNQVVATVDPMAVFRGGEDKKPIGGHIMAHASQTRLYLKKGKGQNRVAKIYDSPSMPDNIDAKFAITENGVSDEIKDKDNKRQKKNGDGDDE
ncbi:unnamed protein product [Vitrella brassicaformis CCMP3155]|uniref:DNA repair protein RAD51 homolog n=1 Tax=Vitrella brassicaformis (strain CCMP3155) TaxID=1169540 RepID=A0A0G4EA33_VITBC|nr:unnamed protein product [Vitrella brassicaformis CCMP3155]|eukprot:CEL92076.1 unnamed protein product [Vitrella brassicaformis CCMP3155]